MDTQNCIFCKIVAGQLPAATLYESEQVLAFLDIGPLSEGHTLVIPKEHHATLDTCPIPVLREVASSLGRIARAVVAATQCEGYNLLCNNGRVAGQVVDHVHFHIIPRSPGDRLLGGWHAKAYPAGRMDELARALREQLERN
jgi:histidine triad (HIT) family protein